MVACKQQSHPTIAVLLALHPIELVILPADCLSIELAVSDQHMGGSVRGQYLDE